MFSLLGNMLNEQFSIQRNEMLAESLYDKGPEQFYKDVLNLKSCKDIFTLKNGVLYLTQPADCPDELIKLINKIKHETSKGIHSISVRMHQKIPKIKMTDMGSFYGTVTAFGFSKEIDRYVEPNYTIYHVCPGKYAEQIKKEGLKARSAEFNSGNKDIVNGKQMFSGQVFCYKALFAVRKWQECKEVARDLGIQNPCMVKFVPKNTTWYVDQIMNNAAENKVKTSCVTFDDIPASQIREIKPMK